MIDDMIMYELNDEVKFAPLFWTFETKLSEDLIEFPSWPGSEWKDD